ncbi:hypothetical protein C7999DRAFT_27509 [Corynascus novoguineensis]|uniref:Tyrosinase copper-binding domain-containing protein n=1 Tax=Corynascus novoguineensis TaxID=1126955 RepID=A0AAN7D1A6_9PEZI|nr:hypothetical protein C7999DRAFT_27509 [Corynascus novoguineensis]
MTRFHFSLLPLFGYLVNALVLAQYSGYDYGFNIEKRIKRQLGRRSAMVVQDRTGDEVHVRQEIRQLEQDHDLWTLYMLGLSMLQYTDQASPVSHYGLAGIHGMPHQTWGGVEPVTGSEGTGYCTHSSILFPTWHRSYMALYEQALYDLIQLIATLWPASERPRYERAARRFRLPYWDWAASPPPGESVLPRSIGGSPFVDVDGPNGLQRIANPLFSYQFKPLDRTAFNSDPWNVWTQTLRSPSSGGPDAQSNNSLVALNLGQNRASLAQRLYSLFSYNDNYTTFSNNAMGGWTESVESLHDTIHELVGGFGPIQPSPQPGHMAYLEWSAFDPIFFLHHCMVDRILALWQAIYPNSWVSSSQALLDSYTIRRGQRINSSTALTPFFLDDNGTFWTSDSVRDHTKFGYLYTELLQGPVTTSSNNNLLVATQTRTIKRTINRMYGSFNPASLFLEKLRAQGAQGGGTGSFQTSREAKTPHHTLIESRIFAAGGNGNRYHEWIANVRAEPSKNRAATSSGDGVRVSSISFFLGDISPERLSEEACVGTMGVFTAARLSPQQETTSRVHEVTVTGNVPLTAALVKKITDGELAGLTPQHVVPYLKRNLKMVVRGVRGELVMDIEDEERCVDGMAVQIVSLVTEAPWSDEELPRRREGRVEFEMC